MYEKLAEPKSHKFLLVDFVWLFKRWLVCSSLPIILNFAMYRSKKMNHQAKMYVVIKVNCLLKIKKLTRVLKLLSGKRKNGWKE